MGPGEECFKYHDSRMQVKVKKFNYEHTPGEGADFFPKKEQCWVSICCRLNREDLLKMASSLAQRARSTSCP
jgi:hypothetical protein